MNDIEDFLIDIINNLEADINELFLIDDIAYVHKCELHKLVVLCRDKSYILMDDKLD